jgi:hypothetical protein
MCEKNKDEQFDDAHFVGMEPQSGTEKRQRGGRSVENARSYYAGKFMRRTKSRKWLSE